MNDSSWQQFLTNRGARWDEQGVVGFGNQLYPNLPNDRPILTDLSTWTVLQIVGPDARQFLQGQVSCDMNHVAEDRWQRGANCNIKGRALASFYCIQQASDDGDTFLLVLPRSTAELTLNNLKKYAVFSKVNIERLPDCRIFGLIATHQQAEQILRQQLSGENTACQTELVTSLSLPGDRYLILTSNDCAQSLWQQLAESCDPQGYPAWNLAAIRAGMGEVEAKTSGEFVPQLLNFHLTGGISFTKGCYLGQEIVARMAYRGNVKRHLRRAQVATDLLPVVNDSVHSSQGEQSVGNIVSAVKTDSDSIEVLAVVADNAFDGDDVYLDPQKHHKLHFLSLPYAITK